MKLTLARRNTKIPFTIPIIILLLLVLVSLNQWRIFSKTQHDLEEEIAAMDSLKLKQDTIMELTKDKNLLMDKVKSLQYMIPSHKDHADLLGYLDSVFVKYNVQIIQLEFDNYIEKNDFNEIPINISIKGQYSEIIDLLKEFRIGNRPLRIDELHMDGGNDNSIVYCDILSYAFFRETAE